MFNLRTLLISSISFLIFFKGIFIIYFFHKEYIREIETITQYQIINIKENISNNISIFLKGIFQAIDLIEEKDILKLKNFKEIDSIEFLDEKHQIFLKNKIMNLKINPFFEVIKNNYKKFYSHLYLIENDFYMIYAFPVFKNNLFHGVMAFEIKFNFLNLILNNNKNNLVKNILVMNKNGKIVNHDLENNKSDKEIENHFNHYKKHGKNHLKHKNNFLYFHQLKDFGDDIHLCIIYSAQDLIFRLEKHQKNSLLYAFFFVLLAYLIALLFANKILNAINFISLELLEIKNLKLKTKIFKTPFNEINTMIENINDTKNALNNFKKFVPYQLLMELMKNNILFYNQGKIINLTVFFSDIRNFTSIIEKVEINEIFDQLNEYFEIFDFEIKKYQGILDKYIGDSVMAFWGPFNENDQKNNIMNTLNCILSIQIKIKKLNQKWKKEGLNQLITNFGVSTGDMFVGTIGSQERLQYTLLGDHVNTASRLESLNKEFGTEILVNEATYLMMNNDFYLRPIAKVTLKGKQNEQIIYELIGSKKIYDKNLELKVELTKEAFDFYISGNFLLAKEKYNKILEEFSDDLVIDCILKKYF